MEKIDIYSDSEVITSVLVEEDLSGLLSALDPYPHIYAVMDGNVAMHCPAAQEIAHLMNRMGVPGMLVDATERDKTMDTVMDICSWLMDNGADRDALVLAVGGGITTDMVGFASSIYKRGVRFAYVPTTLLAQVDASIGGKTGVNFERYKNILGLIRQPEFTYICPKLLESLPYRDFMSGAAELLKTFIIEDGGYYRKAVDVLSDMEKGFAILPEEDASEYWSDCISSHQSELRELIAAAVRVKAGVVSRDQFEKGERRKLNLGHTFAHAIETLAQTREYREISDGNGVTHGEAVAMGLVLAARLSDRIAGKSELESLEGELNSDLIDCGIASYCPFTIDEMAHAMRKDKKAEGGKIHFVLPKAIGDVEIVDLSVDEVCRLMA